MGDYVGLHVGDRTHLLRETLDGLAGRLSPERFVRIHRSRIVQIDRVREFHTLTNRDALLRLRDGTELKVSRTYRGELDRALEGSRPPKRAPDS